MIPTKVEVMSYFLVPGAAEEFKRVANGQGNMALCGVALGLQRARNGVYGGVALAALSGISLCCFSFPTAYVGLAGLGLSAVIIKNSVSFLAKNADYFLAALKVQETMKEALKTV